VELSGTVRGAFADERSGMHRVWLEPAVKPRRGLLAREPHTRQLPAAARAARGRSLSMAQPTTLYRIMG